MRLTFTNELRIGEPGLSGPQIQRKVASIAGETWKAMSEVEKEKYNARAKADKERYDRELAEAKGGQVEPQPDDTAHADEEMVQVPHTESEQAEPPGERSEAHEAGTNDPAGAEDSAVAAKPKKSKTAYNFFVQEVSEFYKSKVRAEDPNLKGLELNKIVNSKIGQRWKELSTVEKAPYELKAADAALAATPALQLDKAGTAPPATVLLASAPKKCAAPKVEDRTEMEVTLQLTRPASETRISCFLIKLRNEETQVKKEIAIEDSDLWQRLPVGGIFPWTLDELDPCTCYRVQVLAIGTNAKQKGMISDATTFCTAAPPLPAPDQPELDHAEHNALLLWLKRPLSDLLPLSMLELSVVARHQGTATPTEELVPVPIDAWSDTASGDTFPYILSDREPNVTYTIKLRARGDDGWGRRAGDADWPSLDWSEWSVPLNAKTATLKDSLPSPDRCVPPLIKAITETSVTLEITRPNSQVDIISFEWRVKEFNEAEEGKKPRETKARAIPQDIWRNIIAGEMFLYEIDGLKPGRRYSVQVNAMGCQPDSDGTEKQKRHNRKWSKETDACKFVTQMKAAPQPPPTPVLVCRDADSFQLNLMKPHSETPLTRLELLVVQSPAWLPKEDDEYLFEEVDDNELQASLELAREDWHNLSSGDAFSFRLTADELLDLGFNASGEFTCMMRGKGDHRVKQPGWGDFSSTLIIPSQQLPPSASRSASLTDAKMAQAPADDEEDDEEEGRREEGDEEEGKISQNAVQQKVKKLISASSGKFTPANRTKALTWTAQHVLEAYYSKPYPPLKKEANSMDHVAKFGIERPNHGLANAMRKACLVDVILKDVSPAMLKNDFLFVTTMQVAMLFESVGRESEAGYRAPEYQRYRDISCKKYSAFAKDCGLEGWQDCEAALRGMFSTTKQTDATSSPDRVAKVQAVFEIAHNLDMMRCTYEMNERFAEIKKSLK